jgi:hypothetical protein
LTAAATRAMTAGSVKVAVLPTWAWFSWVRVNVIESLE